LRRLLVVDGPQKNLVFAQSIWPNIQKTPITSIGDAVKKLKSQGKLWGQYSFECHRRMALIQEQLPKIKTHQLTASDQLPARKLGGWTLENEETMWFSPETNSPFPLGEFEFQEDKSAPSRAYLKLWEFFLRSNIKPQEKEICLDMGSSPGGWTWVLAKLNCQVISVDKAELHPSLQNKSNIQILKKDAFNIDPKSLGKIDWFFSDIICYPKDLLDLVEKWRASGQVKNFVCTIKFQGTTDFETLEKFKAIPGSNTIHLGVNKHEVTWYLVPGPVSGSMAIC
jgi:23S rRNA (cytidine2498-2'-O)-methyltransferase